MVAPKSVYLNCEKGKRKLQELQRQTKTVKYVIPFGNMGTFAVVVMWQRSREDERRGWAFSRSWRMANFLDEYRLPYKEKFSEKKWKFTSRTWNVFTNYCENIPGPYEAFLILSSEIVGRSSGSTLSSYQIYNLKYFVDGKEVWIFSLYNTGFSSPLYTS